MGATWPMRCTSCCTCLVVSDRTVTRSAKRRWWSGTSVPVTAGHMTSTAGIASQTAVAWARSRLVLPR